MIQASHVRRRIDARWRELFHFVAPPAAGSLARSPDVHRAARRARADSDPCPRARVSRATCSRCANVAPRTPILLQDHADRRAALLARGVTGVAGSRRRTAVSFCAREQARAVLAPRTCCAPTCRGVRDPGIHQPVHARRSRGGARRHRTCTAIPACCGSGTSTATRIRSRCSREWPRRSRNCRELQLWCCFGTAPLFDAGARVHRRRRAAARARAPARPGAA